MRIAKLLVMFALVLAILLPVGGCSSEPDSKSPKAEGPADPSLKRAGRGPDATPSGAPGKPGGPGAVMTPITKD